MFVQRVNIYTCRFRTLSPQSERNDFLLILCPALGSQRFPTVLISCSSTKTDEPSCFQVLSVDELSLSFVPDSWCPLETRTKTCQATRFPAKPPIAPSQVFSRG